MQAGSTFADVLEATLGGGPGVPPAYDRWNERPVTPPLFVFAAAAPRYRAGAYAAPGGRPAQPSRPPLTLSSRARRALERLNELGAGLDDLTAQVELRGTYRRLARLYHPDRHPHASPAEAHELGRTFARLTADYRELAAAFRATPTVQ